MGFLKNFFSNAQGPGAPARPASSFSRVTEEQLEAHLRIVKYGEFLLTDAIRPSYDLQVTPVQGYRHESYQDNETGSRVPVLMAAVSRELLFEVFMDMLDPFGNVADVVLETSHDRGQNGHEDLYREHIDMPVLKSILWDFEELLTHDGCTGIAVMNPSVPREIQFDEHKLLIVYGNDLTRFEAVLGLHDVPCMEDMQFITEAEHIHSSCDRYMQQFGKLCVALGMDEFCEV
jgi:hypothetical protein